MNRGGFIIGTLLLLFGGTSIAQHLSHQVLVPAAGIAICTSSHLSQSIGENAVVILSSGNRDLTQGFQQPRIKLVNIDQPQGTGVKVYPIPASECLNIELYGEEARRYLITFMDISGRVVHSSELDFGDSYWYVHNIIVRNFVKGLYFVRVRCQSGHIDRTFKVNVI
ncbi:MAG: T9SS type A sorting domain-containing protein [Bacteroidales bacterium]|nr:T9SS type A sorting domain-containing protein [Bacteroidales bacterium]